MRLPQNIGAFTKGVQQAIQNQFNQLLGVTGTVFYIDAVNGDDKFDGLSPVDLGDLRSGPVRTLAVGYALLTSGKNDVLVVIGDGTTGASLRISSKFTWAKSAAHMIGMCSPSLLSQRSRIAPPSGATAFANFFEVSGNGCYFKNIQWFQGFAIGVAASICMKISGARNVFDNCHFAGMGDTDGAGAQSATSRNLLVTADENVFNNCTVGIDTIARTVANASVEFAGGCARNVFNECLFPMLATVATVLGVKALTGGIDRFQLFNRCLFINAINSSGVSVTGLGSVGANGGGPNGAIVYKDCTLVGIAEWEQTTKTSVLVSGPAVNSGTGIAVNPA